MKLRVVEYRKVWYAFSAVLVAVSAAALLLWGLRPGIDFTGGSLTEISFASPVTAGDVRGALGALGETNATVQETGVQAFLIRTEALTEARHQELLAALRLAHGDLEERRFDSIGPVIGRELRRTAVLGIVVSLILIGLYIAWSFRSAEAFISSKKCALLSVVKTGHDVLISVGAFAILGHFFGYEADMAFIGGSLTIRGYSINDGVVVLDRTRENLKNRISPYLDEVVDRSIDQTLARSINTSVTVFLALLAVFAFGGETTRPFALLLLIGVLVGTYSSIFVASPLLVTWSKGKR